MSPRGEERTASKLKPVLGPVQLVFYGVGVIVGAGVYSVIGSAAGIAHQNLWLSFAVGAFVASLTGFAYAEMSTSFSSSGAEYQWLKNALPRFAFVSFATGLVILMGGAAATATVAVAFGGYLRTFVDVPIWLSASALLAACTALNIWGLRESSWANIVFTAVEVAGLIFVIAAGSATGRLFEPLLATTRDGVLPAAATVFFVYLGFEKIANMTEEVRSPARTIPRAIFHSIAITTALYILVSLAVMCLATPDELASSDAPLASAIENVWRGGGRMLGAIAIISTANTVLISLVAGSRLAYSMGRDGEIPRMFAALLPDRDTPWVAAIFLFAMSELLVPIGNVKILAELSSLTALLAFLAVNIALIILRYRFPDHARPFRVPFSVGRMPIIPVASIASIGLLMINFDWEIYLAAGGVILLSGLAYVVRSPLRL
ncbi:APC family permease [Bradyrhizobium sp.]|uniref:APC family permease n=1 Tax=Bradyrhizobium sp. TaxID=376 RepID=UPI003C7919AB